MANVTQAQIEGLKKDLITPYPTPEFANDVFLRALKVINQLTAAAQVGDELDKTMREAIRRSSEPVAAQVGEPNQKDLAGYIQTIGRSIEERTIERCAQVAEGFSIGLGEYNGATIAAAIRALKE